VIIAARCKHCGAEPKWRRDADGDPFVAVGSSLPFPCPASPSTVCEPLIQTSGERMVAELARGAGRRAMGRGMRKRAPR
jgi:hypothetical protein